MKNTILIFDNDRNVRREYQRDLGAAGYRVFTAANIQHALECIRDYPIDLVVLELDFPDGSGLDYLYDIMNQDRSLKVIVNSDLVEYKYDFHTWVADAFLTKSTSLSELKHNIEMILSKRTHRSFEINKFQVNPS